MNFKINIQERLKLIRKDKNLSQKTFGDKIGLSSSQIACYETGHRGITDRTIKDICREFNVNEEWFKNGTGEMYLITSVDKNFADILTKIILSDNESLKNIAKKITQLDDKNLDIIEKLIDSLLEGKK